MDKSKKIVVAVVILLIILFVALFFAFQTKEYEVSFFVDGKNVSSEKIEKGKTVTKPEDPTKEGYTFDGWYLGSEEFDFDTEITKNLELTAKWVANETGKVYTVTFDIDGKISTSTTDENGLLNEPAVPTKEGYKFLGWYANGEKVDFTKPFMQDSALVAKWEKEVIKEEKKDSKKEKKSTDTTSKKQTSNTNKTQSNSGNKTQSSNTTKPSKPSKPEQPTAKTYSISFKVDGKTVSTRKIKEGNKIVLPSNPTKTGYTFKGWYSNGKLVTNNTKVTKNMTVTASWDTYTFTVSLINGDNSSPNRLITVYKNGLAITAISMKDGSGKYLTKKNISNGLQTLSYESFVKASSYRAELSDGTLVYATRK